MGAAPYVNNSVGDKPLSSKVQPLYGCATCCLDADIKSPFLEFGGATLLVRPSMCPAHDEYSNLSPGPVACRGHLRDK